MTRFITTHILTALPLHNLNRDQNGMPKSTVDGDVQRARLSAQALKRAARVRFRDHGDKVGSIRTRNATAAIVKAAEAYAARKAVTIDFAAVEAKVKDLVKALTDREEPEGNAGEKKATILFLSQAEIDTVAGAIVDGLARGADLPDGFIRDSTSPSLDVAAFGRMFAKKHEASTMAAIAVSHAVTTHEMTLTADYFAAVEDGPQEHAGGGHLGMAYFTSGTYYRSFTIDVDQLARSWSNFGAVDGREQVISLVEALILALPRGRQSNSAPNVLPHTVLVEIQSTRTAYSFDAPVRADDDGGFAEASAARLAEERRTAIQFDRDIFGPAKVYSRAPGLDFQADPATTLSELVEFIVNAVYEGRA